MGAARDGVEMHGVAYNAQIYVGNTNQNDSFLFGPNPDPQYFKAVYGALADAGVRAINNSWGSQPADVTYATEAGVRAAYAQHYNRGTWLDEAANVSRKGVINVFSAGNSGYANASVRASLPFSSRILKATGWPCRASTAATVNATTSAAYPSTGASPCPVGWSTAPCRVAVTASNPAPPCPRRMPLAHWHW